MFRKSQKVISNSLQDQNIFNILSDELIVQIFSYLDSNQLLFLSLVSKNTRRLANDNHLWFSLFSPTTKNYNKIHFSKLINYKKLYKDRKKLQILQNIAQTWLHDVSDCNVTGFHRLIPKNQRHAFVILFYQLAFSTEVLNENLYDALIGALIFEIEIIKKAYAPFRDYSRSKLYNGIIKMLNELFAKPLDPIDLNAYVYKFSEFMQGIPEEMIKGKGLIWNDKEALIKNIDDILWRMIDPPKTRRRLTHLQHDLVSFPTRKGSP